MFQYFRRHLACVSLVCVTVLSAGSPLMAGTVSVSSSAPVVNGSDIVNNSGGSDAGGDQGHVWSNRPHQGQSFTTGANPGGYLLKAVTMKNLNNSVSSGPTFNLIVGRLTGSGSPEVMTQIGTTETGVAPSYSPNQYLTFTLATPLPLDPGTRYGFLWGSAGQGFVSVNNLDDAAYADGTALSSGDNNSANLSNVILRNVDRVFHLDMDAAVAPGTADLINLPASAITATFAQLNGEVTDIGDGPPSVVIRWGDDDAGGDAGAWDHAEVLAGTQGVGAFSAPTGSTLLPNTTYYFRAFGSNSAGDASASPSLSFTTLPAPPSVANLTATEIAADVATVGAEVIDTGGEDPTVFIYWGTVDEGTNAGAWQNSVLLGVQAGAATTRLSGLLPATTYFHRALATNNGGSGWAASTESFETVTPVPPAVENRGANGITGSSANLRGTVTSTGFEAPTVILHYGDNDGGTTPGAWDQSINLGVRSGDFSLFVAGLDPLTNYFFRCEASNSVGTTWAPAAESFTTTDVTASELVINEIHYDHEPKTERGEFVEIFNPADTPVNLTGWRIKGAIEYAFPSNTVIDANGFLVVAEDPGVLNAVFGVTGLGPYTGKLSNEGERVFLEDHTGTTVDAVDYGIGFPWPTASRGGGSSMELINAGLDNDLGSSWRASGNAGAPGPEVTYVAAGETWSYRKGTSEASSPVDAWRQPGFVEDPSWLTGPTVIGYGDGDDTTLLNDMQGSYTSVYLRKEFTVSGQIPGQLVVRVYYDDAAIVWINGIEVARQDVALGDITFEGIRATDPPGGTPGNAVGSHERAWVDVPIVNPAGVLVPGTNTVAVHAFNTSLGSSDFSIDCEIKTPPPGTPATGVPTPGAPNSVFSPNAPPNIRQVTHFPPMPTSTEDVVITAKVTDPDGVAAVTLSYQLVEPGNYIRLTDAAYETNWTDVAMVDDGSGDDLAAGDAVFSVTLPASFQVHRRLVRYRITVEDNAGFSVRTPFTDDESPNFAYFCYDGVPDWTGAKAPGQAALTYPATALDSVAVYHLITREEDVVLCQWTGPTDGVYRYLGTWVYDGKVYDHMRYRIRGRASTRQVGRNKWKINFNRARPLEARDNYGRKYEVPWDKINVLPGSNPWWRNNASTDGTLLCESAGFRFYQLAGTIGSNTHFFHFRVIDDAEEAPAGDQYGGDFWGVYIAIEQPEAEFLDERGLPSGNLYNVHGGSGSTKRNQGPTQNTDFSDLFAFQGLHGSGTSQAQWEAKLEFDHYFGWNIGNLAINNSDARPQENVNYYHNPETGKWSTLPWDIDLTWEDAPHLGRGDTAAWERIYHCLQYPDINQAYENRVRECLDLLFDNDQGAQVIDEYAGFVTQGGPNNLVEASQAMWDHHPRKNKKGIWYANFNTTLLPNRTFADYVQYSKDFVTVGGYGRSNLATKQVDSAIPDQPTITFAGAAGYPTSDLTFVSSAFSDPQGAGTFGAMEWRVGEIHDPSTPGWLAGDRYVYEIESFYQTTRLTPFVESFTFPSDEVRVGHTYRARVRHIDSSGRASHWSDPVEFTATAPNVTPWQENLMITEIMYHPTPATPGEVAMGWTTGDFEYLELKNVSDTLTLDLSELRFTKGVDFDFDMGSIFSLAPGSRVLVVRNIAAFESRHGTGLPVAGAWEPGDNLSNGGENLKLSFGAGEAIHEFAFDDSAPWPESPDGLGPSLVLIAPERRPPHGDPFSWRPSTAVGGNPGGSDATSFAGDPGADDDQDGIPAFLEYALGSNDAVASPDVLPVIGTGRFNDGGGVFRDYPTYSYRRNLAADDVLYEVQSSETLLPGSWETGAAFTELVSMADHGDGTATMTWRSTVPVGDLDREFIRLAVSQRP